MRSAWLTCHRAPPTRLSPAGVDAESPRIVISPGGVAQVVWTGTKEAEHDLELSTVHLQVNASWKASITITHDMPCAKMTADRIILLKDGIVYAEGSYEDLENSEDEWIRTFFN